ncbi:MAG: glycosyltransferase [Proteobacteria bacterium]|nr:glycosyltransferase [Pseudomonadota bacterium]
MSWPIESLQPLADFADSELLRLRPGHTAAKLFAFLRFPVDSQKRKRLRYQLVEASELGLSASRGRYFAPSEPGPNAPPPSVSAIIPNYNHARFLDRRIQSILRQRSPVSELIILDDASTDNSLEVIKGAIAGANVPCRVIENERNSGSIFQQWQKGLASASGDIVWICESDDDCDDGFLATLVPYFADPSIMLAFGNINFIDREGNDRENANAYRGYSNFFARPQVASAHTWFNGPLGTRCVINNVGGCIFRRQNLSDDVRSELATYRTCGDWFLYSRLARGGKIAFDPNARASFRIHDNNTSISSFSTVEYYRECLRVLQAFRRHYGIERRVVRVALQNIYHQCLQHLGPGAARKIIGPNSIRSTASVAREINHVIVSVHISEISVIKDRASELAKSGDDVSLIVDGRNFAQELRSELPGEIAVFVREKITDPDANFCEAFGATSLLHWP